jgi:hypothetical protein
MNWKILRITGKQLSNRGLDRSVGTQTWAIAPSIEDN